MTLHLGEDITLVVQFLAELTSEVVVLALKP